MAKHIITFFTVALLLNLQLTTFAARPVPAAFTNNTLKSQHPQDIEAKIAVAEEGGSCEGVDKEECLMRRTLAAHLDYIYTQKHKP